MTAVKGHIPGAPRPACRQLHQSLLSLAGVSCLYKPGKGPKGLVAFISTLSLASFLGFFGLLMPSPPSCRKCFHLEDTATHNSSLSLLSAPCKLFRRGSQGLSVLLSPLHISPSSLGPSICSTDRSTVLLRSLLRTLLDSGTPHSPDCFCSSLASALAVSTVPDL